MKATQFLMDEHEIIRRAIVVIDEMAARIAQGETPDEHDVESIRQFLRYFDDQHQEKEESILFPALLKTSHAGCSAADHASLCQNTFEHNQQRSLLEGIEDSLKTHNERDFLYYARRLGEVVRAHIRSEEEQLFKRADMLLSPEEDERVAKELSDYGTPQQAGRLMALRERLLALEMKYRIHLNASAKTKKVQHV